MTVDMYCTLGHYFTLIKHHTVNCHSNSFIGRTVNTTNALPVFAFNCESVNCFLSVFMMIVTYRNIYAGKVLYEML